MEDFISKDYEDDFDVEIELRRTAAGLIRARKALDALIDGGEEAVPTKADRDALWKARQELLTQITRIENAMVFLKDDTPAEGGEQKEA